MMGGCEDRQPTHSTIPIGWPLPSQPRDQHRYSFLVAGVLLPKFPNQFAFFVNRPNNQGLPAKMGIALTLGFATVGLLSQQTQKKNY